MTCDSRANFGASPGRRRSLQRGIHEQHAVNHSTGFAIVGNRCLRHCGRALSALSFASFSIGPIEFVISGGCLRPKSGIGMDHREVLLMSGAALLLLGLGMFRSRNSQSGAQRLYLGKLIIVCSGGAAFCLLAGLGHHPSLGRDAFSFVTASWSRWRTCTNSHPALGHPKPSGLAARNSWMVRLRGP